MLVDYISIPPLTNSKSSLQATLSVCSHILFQSKSKWHTVKSFNSTAACTKIWSNLAGPEGCSSSSRLGWNAPWLVGTLRRGRWSTQLLRHFLNLFAVGPHPPPSTWHKARDEWYQAFHVFRRPSISMYYCQQKPKNRKNRVGLGTRLDQHQLNNN